MIYTPHIRWREVGSREPFILVCDHFSQSRSDSGVIASQSTS
jgi:hypothetical protein